MSNSIVLNRITQQIQERKIEKAVPFQPPVVVDKPRLSPPIDPEELKRIFMSEISNLNITNTESNEKLFLGVEDFANWYEVNKDKFTDKQKTALDTLIQARNMIDAGCKCQRHTRKEQAENYYKNFWINNQQTDLPLKVAEILGVNSIKFLSDSQIFLNFVR